MCYSILNHTDRQTDRHTHTNKHACMHAYKIHTYIRKSLQYWACGVVVSMFDFHRSDRGSNPGRGGEFS